MNPKIFVALLILLILPGCISDYAPPEMAMANAMMETALDGAQANRAKVVEAYTQELLKAYRAQMDLITKLALTNAMTMAPDGEMMVSVTVVEKVNAERAKREREIELQLQAKAAEFMNDQNFAVASEINKALGAWTDTYVTKFAGRLDFLLKEGGKLIGVEPEK